MDVTMVIRVPLLTTYATVKHVDVSLPLVPCLIDGEEYMDPRDVRPLEGQELRRARAPSLRFLVKLAMRCDNAEQLGKRLRCRYQRQALQARRAAELTGREYRGLR
jgi:hypothetical protein